MGEVERGVLYIKIGLGLIAAFLVLGSLFLPNMVV